MRRYKQAAEVLLRDLASQPDDAYTRAFLSTCLCLEEDHEAAADQAAHAIRLRPTLAYAHFAAAWNLFVQGRKAEGPARDRLLERSRGALEEALRLEPEDPSYFAQLAEIHLWAGRLDEMLEAANRGLSLDAKHLRCLEWRIWALYKLRRLDEAEAALESVLMMAPDRSWVQCFLGCLHNRRGRRRPSLAAFHEALRLDPDASWIHVNYREAQNAWISQDLWNTVLGWGAVCIAVALLLGSWSPLYAVLSSPTIAFLYHSKGKRRRSLWFMAVGQVLFGSAALMLAWYGQEGPAAVACLMYLGSAVYVLDDLDPRRETAPTA
jgi:tetratricopeptide (TPR) repeat protein